jgi:uncharacterized membrane protein
MTQSSTRISGKPYLRLTLDNTTQDRGAPEIFSLGPQQKENIMIMIFLILLPWIIFFVLPVLGITAILLRTFLSLFISFILLYTLVYFSKN